MMYAPLAQLGCHTLLQVYLMEERVPMHRKGVGSKHMHRRCG